MFTGGYMQFSYTKQGRRQIFGLGVTGVYNVDNMRWVTTTFSIGETMVRFPHVAQFLFIY